VAADRVGWRHKANTEAYRVIAYPPQHKLFLVGWCHKAGRVGWRHKANTEAYRVIAYPPQHKLFLVGWLFRC